MAIVAERERLMEETTRLAVLERVDQQPQLARATHERSPVAHGDRHERPRFDCGPARNGFGLALRVDGCMGLEHDLAFGCTARHLTDENPVDGRRRLQPAYRGRSRRLGS